MLQVVGGSQHLPGAHLHFAAKPQAVHHPTRPGSPAWQAAQHGGPDTQCTVVARGDSGVSRYRDRERKVETRTDIAHMQAHCLQSSAGKGLARWPGSTCPAGIARTEGLGAGSRHHRKVAGGRASARCTCRVRSSRGPII